MTRRLCQSLMDGGLRAVKVMALVAKICGDIIVASSVLLPQVVSEARVVLGCIKSFLCPHRSQA